MTRPCEDCASTRIAPLHLLFNLGCIWCGARLIGRLRQLPRPNAEIKARQERVLADWTAFGHDRTELLRLSREPMPVVAPLDSGPPTQEKPRSAKKKSSTGSTTTSSPKTT